MENLEHELLREIRSDVKVLLQGQAHTNARVDAINSKLDEHIDDDAVKHRDIDDRVAKQENWRSRVMGMFVIVGAGVGFLASIAKDAIAQALNWGS